MASKDKTYSELRDEFPARCKRAKILVEKARLEGLEVPSSLDDELQTAESQRDNALKGRTLKEAREEVLKAIDRVDQVLSNVLRIFIAKPFQEVRTARDSFKGHEDLAAQHIPNYNMHTKNFLEVEGLLDDYALCGKRLDSYHAAFLRKQLREFLRDFKTGEKALSVAIKKAEKAKWMSRSIVAVGVATLIVSIIGFKGCIGSSQQTSQPEATVSEAELQSETNNPSPNPKWWGNSLLVSSIENIRSFAGVHESPTLCTFSPSSINTKTKNHLS